MLERFPPILGQETPGYRLPFDIPQLRTDLAPDLRPPLGLCAGLFR
jgi:hypothetical protein